MQESPNIPTLPRFRIATLLWVMALLASGMGAFGPWWGIVAAAIACVLFQMPWRKLMSLKVEGALAFGLLLVGLLLPTQVPRDNPRHVSSRNNLEILMLSMHVYHDAHGVLPPAYIADDLGTRLHSWRTLILPYIELGSLYQTIQLDEPWDNAANQSVLSGWLNELMESPYVDNQESAPDKTHYFAVIDEQAVLRPGKGVRLGDITDGASKTIVLIEDVGRGVNWYEPRDLTLEEAIDLLTGEGKEYREWIETGYFVSTVRRGGGRWPRLVGWADGHVSYVGRLSDRRLARALLTRAGGEDIPRDFPEEVASRLSNVGYLIHWPRVISLVVFLMLSALPFFRGKRLLVGMG